MGNPFNSITLAQLCNFHTLAKSLHFTDAARELYITQPTLSASIKALETELDVPLLIREGRRNVRLTKYGIDLDRSLDELLPRLDEAIESVKAGGSNARSLIHIGTIPTIQYDYLPAVLKSYWNTFGYDRKTRITVEFSNALIKGLKKQDYDVVFCAHVPEEQGLEFIPMLSKPMVAVVNSKHPWAKRESISMQDLTKVKFATYHFDTPIGNETRQLLEEHGLKKPSLLFDDEFMLSSVVAANKEIVGLMLDTFEIDPFKDKVTVLPIDEVDGSWHKICLAYDSRIHQSKLAQQFIEVARDCARGGGLDFSGYSAANPLRVTELFAPAFKRKKEVPAKTGASFFVGGLLVRKYPWRAWDRRETLHGQKDSGAWLISAV